jgi:hypothetical protein
MSYELHAFIGRQERFSAVEDTPIKTVALAQGMALVPLTPALGGWLYQGHKGARSTHPGFELLSERVYQLGVRLSERGAVAYVEAFDFGNVGGQDAIVWQHGGVVMEPLHSFDGLAAMPESRPRRASPGAAPCHPINEALRRLGVEKSGQYDEFDALGLGRHRKTEGWIE